MRNSLVNLWRTALIIAGIAFAVSIMISANIIMDSASAAFILHFEDDTYHDLEIQASFSENFSFTQELEEYLEGLQIAETNLVLEKLLPIRSIYPYYANQSESDPGFRVVGFSGNGSQVEELDSRYWQSIGQERPASLEAYLLSYDECVIDADIKNDIQRGTPWNVFPGDPLPGLIDLNLTSQPNIAFIIDGQRFTNSLYDQVWEAFFNIELLWDSWDPDNRPVSAIRIKLNDWTQIFDIKEQLEGQLGNDISVKVLRKIGEEQLAGIHSYEDALQAVVLIATAIEFLFVFSQMVVIVFTERRREIGQLRILGATRFSILKMIMAESLLYGIIGSLIGAYIGMLGSALLTQLIAPQLASTTIYIVVDLGTVAFGIVYGILITVIAALLPSAYVAYQPPQQAVQSYGRSANRLGLRASVLFVGTAFLLFFWGLGLLAQVKAKSLLDLTLFMDNSLTIGIILLSAILFEIVLIRLLIPIFEKTWVIFPAFVRAIASRSILRSFRRNSASMITAAVGIAFVITATIFAASLQKTLPGLLERNFGEIILDSGEGNEQVTTMFENITNLVPEVQEYGYALGSQLLIDGTRRNVVGIDDYLIFNSRVLKPPKILEGPSNAFRLVATTSNSSIPNCILSVTMADRLHLSTGDIIRAALLSNASLQVPLQVIALVEPTIYLNDGDNIFTDYLWLANYTRQIGRGRWFFMASDSPDEAYTKLKRRFSNTFYRIIPVFKQQESIEDTLEKQSILFEVLLALVMLASLLSQGTAYLMAAIEQEREVGIIRASGAEESQVFQIFAAEAMMMMATSIIVGIIDAAILSGLLFHLASAASIDVQIDIPWILILTWLFIAILFHYLASRIAFRRIRAQTPAQALRLLNQ